MRALTQRFVGRIAYQGAREWFIHGGQDRPFLWTRGQNDRNTKRSRDKKGVLDPLYRRRHYGLGGGERWVRRKPLLKAILARPFAETKRESAMFRSST